MLKKAGPRSFPPAAHAHQPREEKPKREMTTIQCVKLLAAGTEREHPGHSGKHADHTAGISIRSWRQGNPQGHVAVLRFDGWNARRRAGPKNSCRKVRLRLPERRNGAFAIDRANDSVSKNERTNL